MNTPKRPAAKRKPEPCPSEAETALHNLLIIAKPTHEERRMAVRLLLRQASKSLERGA